MKAVKFIACFMLFAACFVSSGEIYQSYLSGFTGGMYYVYDCKKTTNESTQQFYEQIKKISDDEGVYFLTLVSNSYSAWNSELEIYASQDTQKILQDKYDICEGKFNSIFSGTTKVLFNDISLWPQKAETITDYPHYYLLGDYENIKNVGQRLINVYGDVSNILKSEDNLILWGIYGIRIIIFLFLLLLTWFDIQFNKKKMFLKISMGKSAISIIVEQILIDVIMNTLLSFMTYLVTRSFTCAEFEISNYIVCYIIYLILNALLYLSLLKSDYKAIVYGANISSGFLINCYLLKTIIAIISIFILSSICGHINNSFDYLLMEQKIASVNGYSFLNVQFEYEESEDDGRIQQQETLFRLYDNERLKARGILALNIYGTDNNEKSIDVLLYNQNGRQFISSKITKLIDSCVKADFLFFIPKYMQKSTDYENILIDKVYEYYGLDNTEYSYAVNYYGGIEKSLYLDEQSQYGFEVARNPLIIYCNISDNELMMLKTTGVNVAFEREFFYLSEDEIKKLNDIKGIKEIYGRSVFDICNNGLISLKRTLLMRWVAGIAILVLELFLSVAIVKLEYSMNAKELALKNILGYSIIRKNKAMFLTNMFSIVGGTIINMLFSIIHKNFYFWLPVVCGCLILALEVVVMLINICKCENDKITKILKGGIV